MSLHRLDPTAAETFEEDVAADRVLAGTPRTKVRVTYDAPAEKLCAGEWEASIGTWRVAYEEWEYCLVTAGRCIVTGDDGTVIEAGPGDSFVLEPGFSGTWEVVEPMRKHWVIRTP